MRVAARLVRGAGIKPLRRLWPCLIGYVLLSACVCVCAARQPRLVAYRPLRVSRGTEEGVFVLTMMTALRESWGNPNSLHVAGTHGTRNAWLKWLLLMYGDVKINPGPVYRFPCTFVKNQRGRTNEGSTVTAAEDGRTLPAVE